MLIFRLVTATVLPVIFAAIFYSIEKKDTWKKLSYWKRQGIIGLAFGGIACLATQFGIPTAGVVLNVRNAAPLSAGLLFGGPAGLIAGITGGIYRWVSVAWGIGEYSKVACSLGTFMAGLIGAACRKFMFDNKKASWFYGFFIGMTTEVLHMLLLFLTKMDDLAMAFVVVQKCAVPMILANGVSVMLSMMLISFLGSEKRQRKKEKKQITQTISIALFISVIFAFSITSIFTFVLQNRISNVDTDNLLSLNIQDVKEDIMDASDQNLLEITHQIAEEIQKEGLNHEITVRSLTEERKQKRKSLERLLGRYRVTEINVVDSNGIIVLSSYKDFDLYDMGSVPDGQAAEFLCLLDGREEYVQEYRQTDYSSEIWRKYAGVALSDGGFVQVGYDALHFQSNIEKEVKLAAANRHIGKSGIVFICEEKTKKLISSPDMEATQKMLSNQTDGLQGYKEGERFRVSDQNGNEMFCMFVRTEGYIIVGCIPVSEALFSRNISVYISMFMQIVVFAILFVIIYFLIKGIVVNNIHKVNDALSKITEGNLNTKIDVRDSEEFESLSDDINSTVETLKDYIAQAAARIDRELEFAKSIQLSALPGVFPPYPNRKDFSIYATMDTAKEVGGDFYDFYLLDNDRLGFLIADVSGKGIPAAMFMMTSKTIIKGFVEAGMEVDEIFTHANEKLCESNDAGMFVTAWLGILDLKTGVLSYANAGHNPPVIRQKDGKFEYYRKRPNFVLAGMEGSRYKRNEIQLFPGDEIFLYTDGVTEATNGEEELYGEDRLLEALNQNAGQSVEERLQTVKESVDKFVGDAPQFDDMTMLTVKFYG